MLGPPEHAGGKKKKSQLFNQASASKDPFRNVLSAQNYVRLGEGIVWNGALGDEIWKKSHASHVLFFSIYVKCQGWRSHKDIKTLPTSESYKFPEVLASELAYRAYINIMEHNRTDGVVKAKGKRPPIRFPGRHQRFPTQEAYVYPHSKELHFEYHSIYKQIADSSRKSGQHVHFSPDVSFYDDHPMCTPAHALLNEESRPTISHTVYPAISRYDMWISYVTVLYPGYVLGQLLIVRVLDGVLVRRLRLVEPRCNTGLFPYKG